MTSLTSYFVKDKRDLVANSANVISGEKYRFSFLTDRLVRLEYSPNGVFEDRASQNVIFRNFGKVEFSVNQSETLLQIETKYFTLLYDKNKPFYSGKLTPGNNLRVTLKESDKMWYYGHPEARNFGALNYSLDNYNGKLKYDKGLYSTDGFATLDDTMSYVIDDNDNPINREKGVIDIYLFMLSYFNLRLSSIIASTSFIGFFITKEIIDSLVFAEALLVNESPSFIALRERIAK